MPDKSVNIAVVGAGAIGAATAAFVAKAGWNIEIVCRHQEIADLAQSPGLHVFGVKGEQYVPVRAVKDIKDLSGPKEVVLLATKATDCLEAAKGLLPVLSPNSIVVSLQNGICEDALASFSQISTCASIFSFQSSHKATFDNSCFSCSTS